MYWYSQFSSPSSSDTIRDLGMNFSRSETERVKWILEATTGSSQPLMMAQMPKMRTLYGKQSTLEYPGGFMD